MPVIKEKTSYLVYALVYEMVYVLPYKKIKKVSMDFYDVKV
jgi:hypothetical protein